MTERLKMNDRKPEILMSLHHNHASTLTNIDIEIADVQSTDTAKSFGVVLDHNMSLVKEKTQCRSPLFLMGSISSIRYHITQSAGENLVHAL